MHTSTIARRFSLLQNVLSHIHSVSIYSVCRLGMHSMPILERSINLLS